MAGFDNATNVWLFVYLSIQGKPALQTAYYCDYGYALKMILKTLQANDMMTLNKLQATQCYATNEIIKARHYCIRIQSQ